MRTLVVASSKGGAGKTTIAACLAVEAAGRSTVAIIDADGQASLTGWHAKRGSPDNPRMLAIDPIADKKVLTLAARDASRAGCDYLIIDTPPALMRKIEGAIAIADLVIIPVRPSPLDVDAIDPVVEMCEEAGCPYAFVVNAYPPRSSLTSGTVKALQRKGAVLEEMLGNRTSYAGAMITGKTAAEIDKGDKAEDEVAALWQRICKLTERAKVEKAKATR